MKKKNVLKSITLSICGIGLLAMPAFALEKADYDFLTTKHLYNLCSADIAKHGGEDYSTASYTCRGFISGAIQYHDGVSGTNDLKRLVCYPAGSTLEDGRIVFVAWAESNVNDKTLMNERPVKGLVRALAAKYPCEK
jgi:hypothetical protein